MVHLRYLLRFGDFYRGQLGFSVFIFAWSMFILLDMGYRYQTGMGQRLPRRTYLEIKRRVTDKYYGS